MSQLTEFLTDIADAIRTKTGETGQIPAEQMNEKILSIQSEPEGMFALNVSKKGPEEVTVSGSGKCEPGMYVQARVDFGGMSKYDTFLGWKEQTGTTLSNVVSTAQQYTIEATESGTKNLVACFKKEVPITDIWTEYSLTPHDNLTVPGVVLYEDSIGAFYIFPGTNPDGQNVSSEGYIILENLQNYRIFELPAPKKILSVAFDSVKGYAFAIPESETPDIYYSVNGGNNWEKMTISNYNGSLYSAVSVQVSKNEKEFYIFGDNGVFMLTVDGKNLQVNQISGSTGTESGKKMFATYLEGYGYFTIQQFGVELKNNKLVGYWSDTPNKFQEEEIATNTSVQSISFLKQVEDNIVFVNNYNDILYYFNEQKKIWTAVPLPEYSNNGVEKINFIDIAYNSKSGWYVLLPENRNFIFRSVDLDTWEKVPINNMENNIPKGGIASGVNTFVLTVENTDNITYISKAETTIY